jgi:tetratricopeptide (TPR) repeat protein
MARASAKRGRRPRSNARSAQPVAGETTPEAAETGSVKVESPPKAAAAKPDRKAPEKKPETKARASHAQQPEDVMFFMRLRNHAKWLFALLAGIFALSFVALGVGTGVSGSSLGDVIRDVFGGGSDTPSVSDAQQKVDENPTNTQALRDLATAQQAAGMTAAAALTLEKYLELKPNDTAIAAQLAGLYDAQARKATAESTALSQDSTAGFAQSAFSFPDSNGFLGALAPGPIDTAIATQASVRVQETTERAQELFGKAAAALEHLTKARPQDPTGYLQLGQAAAAAGETEKAVTAFEKFLELAPDDPNAEFVKSQLEFLQQDEVVQG